jgi:hypothetical protein
VNQSQLDSSKDTSNPGDIVSQAQSQGILKNRNII